MRLVCVCVRGAVHVMVTYTPLPAPLAIAIAALNKHKLRSPRIAVMRLPRVLPPTPSPLLCQHLSLACKAVFFVFTRLLLSLLSLNVYLII